MPDTRSHISRFLLNLPNLHPGIKILLTIVIFFVSANIGFCRDKKITYENTGYDMDKPHQHAMEDMGISMAQGYDPMHGFYGQYPMTRESSGTSWQPDSSPLEGVNVMQDDWMFMLHGYCNATYDVQGGPRGDDAFISTNMIMFMMQHPFFTGTWGLKTMVSLEPSMSRTGYPLLFQTGETADGVTHLVDNQHPHDLMMELATTYSQPVTPTSSLFLYFGSPGEPALGPTTFMHRFSGEVIPDAPITHHWLDSTHITYGVITFGYVNDILKIENSFFRGREPDQFRWNIETPRFDSYSVRVSVNPSNDISLQASFGHIVSPEQLMPDLNVNRLSASITYNRKFDIGNWQSTFAYGENFNDPGSALPAYLLESAVTFHEKYTIFGRGEYVYKNELFRAGSPFEGNTFDIGKAEAGVLYNFFESNNLALGVGYSASLYFYPDKLDDDYGDASWGQMLFLRVQI